MLVFIWLLKVQHSYEFIHGEDCQHHSAAGSEELNMILLSLVQKVFRNDERHLDGMVTEDFYALLAHK